MARFHLVDRHKRLGGCRCRCRCWVRGGEIRCWEDAMLRRPAVTAFGCVYLGGCVVFVGFAIRFGYSTGGMRWGIVAGVVAACWCAVFPLIMNKLIDMSYRRFPLRPPCRTGKCSADDYELFEIRDDAARFRCRCSDVYVRNGPRFDWVDASGAVRPYMVRKRCVWRRADHE